MMMHVHLVGIRSCYQVLGLSTSPTSPRSLLPPAKNQYALWDVSYVVQLLLGPSPRCGTHPTATPAGHHPLHGRRATISRRRRLVDVLHVCEVGVVGCQSAGAKSVGSLM